MSLAPSAAPDGASSLAAAGVALAAALIVLTAADAAAAQGPFGIGAPTTAPPEAAGGLLGWIAQMQATYYREFSGFIRAAKHDGSFASGLLLLSFAYGVFHAAGPGHGKAVITSYLFANDESWRRGITLSFASALLQALVAIAVVGVAAMLLGGTASMMGTAVRNIEIASYLLVVAVGCWLAWTKGRGFFAELHARRRAPVALGAAAVVEARMRRAPDDDGHGSSTVSARRRQFQRGHMGQVGACASCGHAHMPEAHEVAGPGGWRRGLSAILAAGLRPCSGAILVLVFALSQGVFWTGVVSTIAMGVGTAMTVMALATLAVGVRSLATRLAVARPGGGLLALRALETCAAVGVILVGVALLTGYMASERMGFV